VALVGAPLNLSPMDAACGPQPVSRRRGPWSVGSARGPQSVVSTHGPLALVMSPLGATLGQSLHP